ncbi:MAG: hypothetical protein ACM3XO_13725 [Bacteroidota bacterium]
MSEQMKQFQKRRRIEMTTIHLCTLIALMYSAWILYHSVTLALNGLAHLIP